VITSPSWHNKSLSVRNNDDDDDDDDDDNNNNNNNNNKFSFMLLAYGLDD
jgi:hypothetical protein